MTVYCVKANISIKDCVYIQIKRLVVLDPEKLVPVLLLSVLSNNGTMIGISNIQIVCTVII